MTAAITSLPAQAAVSALAALDAEAFASAVRASLGKDADPAVWVALTDPAVIARTKSVLGAIDSDVLAQLAQANADLDEVQARCFALGDEGRQEFYDAKAGQADWRRRTQGFRRILLGRMAFVTERRAALIAANAAAHPPSVPGAGKPARKHNRAALEQLARAVARHQETVTSGNGGEGDDDVLWESLRTITAITAGGVALPLIEWLDYLDDVRDDSDG